eukprot:jgi/Botrbrau1/2614/Bobra.145_1s0035.1
MESEGTSKEVVDTLPNAKWQWNMLVRPLAPCFDVTASQIRIGTSGYSYSSWHKPGMAFYPKGIGRTQELSYYAKGFDTVELNGTFYRWHAESTFQNWRKNAEAIRPSFQYVVKAPRTFTHMKRLNVDGDWVDKWQRYWETRVCELKPHLGAVLFQFPTTVERDKPAKKGDSRTNLQALAALGKVLQKGERFVFEFRHPSWFCQEVYEVLRTNDWCLAAVHLCQGDREAEAASAAPMVTGSAEVAPIHLPGTTSSEAVAAAAPSSQGIPGELTLTCGESETKEDASKAGVETAIKPVKSQEADSQGEGQQQRRWSTAGVLPPGADMEWDTAPAPLRERHKKSRSLCRAAPAAAALEEQMAANFGSAGPGVALAEGRVAVGASNGDWEAVPKPGKAGPGRGGAGRRGAALAAEADQEAIAKSGRRGAKRRTRGGFSATAGLEKQAARSTVAGGNAEKTIAGGALEGPQGLAGKAQDLGWTGAMADGTHPPRNQYPLTSSWGAYVRFHGATGQYVGSYGPAVLDEWAEWASSIADGGRTVYMMFNNDGDAAEGLPSAIADCCYLAKALRQRSHFRTEPPGF